MLSFGSSQSYHLTLVLVSSISLAFDFGQYMRKMPWEKREMELHKMNLSWSKEIVIAFLRSGLRYLDVNDQLFETARMLSLLILGHIL